MPDPDETGRDLLPLPGLDSLSLLLGGSGNSFATIPLEKKLLPPLGLAFFVLSMRDFFLAKAIKADFLSCVHTLLTKLLFPPMPPSRPLLTLFFRSIAITMFAFLAFSFSIFFLVLSSFFEFEPTSMSCSLSINFSTSFHAVNSSRSSKRSCKMW